MKILHKKRKPPISRRFSWDRLIRRPFIISIRRAYSKIKKDPRDRTPRHYFFGGSADDSVAENLACISSLEGTAAYHLADPGTFMLLESQSPFLFISFLLFTFTFLPGVTAWALGEPHDASSPSSQPSISSSSMDGSRSETYRDDGYNQGDGLNPSRFSLLAGPFIYKGYVGAALAIRYQLSSSEFGIPSSTQTPA
jgi:hypothetical protein